MRYRFGSLGDGGIVRRRKRLGIPDNELSAFKADDLEDLVVRTPPAGPGRVKVGGPTDPSPV
jgi:hypothetical protein